MLFMYTASVHTHINRRARSSVEASERWFCWTVGIQFPCAQVGDLHRGVPCHSTSLPRAYAPPGLDTAFSGSFGTSCSGSPAVLKDPRASDPAMSAVPEGERPELSCLHISYFKVNGNPCRGSVELQLFRCVRLSSAVVSTTPSIALT